jgi:hypothetical protein
MSDLETYLRSDGSYDLVRIIRDAFGEQKEAAENFIFDDLFGESDIAQLAEQFREVFLAARAHNVALSEAEEAECENAAREVLSRPDTTWTAGDWGKLIRAGYAVRGPDEDTYYMTEKARETKPTGLDTTDLPEIEERGQGWRVL